MSADYEPDLMLKAELDRLVMLPAAAGTWRDVEDRVRRKRRRRRGAGALAAAVVVAAAGYGGYSLYTDLRPERAVVAITDSPAGNLTGVRAELWTEIQRVREQTESGALAWADIERTWDATEGVAFGSLQSVNADKNPDNWMSFLSILEQELLTEESGPDVTIYLTDEAGDGAALLTKVMAMPEVKSCTYVSKADALEELRKYFRNNPAILSGLMANPLPNSLEVRLNDVEQAASFAARLAGWPGVDQILYATVDYGGLLALLEGLTPLGSDGSLPTSDSSRPSASTADRCSTTLPGRSTRTWSFLRARPPGPNFA
jgi:hypothetical protein